MVVCNYRGTLINGTEFDSSYKRGQPATFAVNQVIRGWSEAVQLMPVGSKWQIFIPSEMAYGPRGAGPDIGPNATLIFEVELLSIQAKPAAAAPAAPAGRLCRLGSRQQGPDLRFKFGGFYVDTASGLSRKTLMRPSARLNPCPTKIRVFPHASSVKLRSLMRGRKSRV